MRNLPALIASDYRGLCRVCGPGVGNRWLWCVLSRLPACLKRRNLQPADVAMGEGPFRAVHPCGSSAKLAGTRVISGIREIWVRNVYLDGDWVTIGPEDVVVDLGANKGNFTNLALGRAPGVRVVAVEADRVEVGRLERSLTINGWRDRCRVLNCFVGGDAEFQHRLRTRDAGQDVPHLTEDEFLRETALTRIDFLKCDIEGSEFALFTPASRILAMTDTLVMEIHPRAGDAEALLNVLRGFGFELRILPQDTRTLIVQGKRAGSRPIMQGNAARG